MYKRQNLDSDVNGITVNQYFVQHPEMILGEMKEVSGPYGMETTCAPMEGADLELQLQEAVKQIKGSMVPAVDVETELDEMPESIPACLLYTSRRDCTGRICPEP